MSAKVRCGILFSPFDLVDMRMGSPSAHALLVVNSVETVLGEDALRAVRQNLRRAMRRRAQVAPVADVLEHLVRHAQLFSLKQPAERQRLHAGEEGDQNREPFLIRREVEFQRMDVVDLRAELDGAGALRTPVVFRLDAPDLADGALRRSEDEVVRVLARATGDDFAGVESEVTDKRRRGAEPIATHGAVEQQVAVVFDGGHDNRNGRTGPDGLRQARRLAAENDHPSIRSDHYRAEFREENLGTIRGGGHVPVPGGPSIFEPLFGGLLVDEVSESDRAQEPGGMPGLAEFLGRDLARTKTLNQPSCLQPHISQLADGSEDAALRRDVVAEVIVNSDVHHLLVGEAERAEGGDDGAAADTAHEVDLHASNADGCEGTDAGKHRNDTARADVDVIGIVDIGTKSQELFVVCAHFFPRTFAFFSKAQKETAGGVTGGRVACSLFCLERGGDFVQRANALTKNGHGFEVVARKLRAPDGVAAHHVCSVERSARLFVRRSQSLALGENRRAIFLRHRIQFGFAELEYRMRGRSTKREEAAAHLAQMTMRPVLLLLVTLEVDSDRNDFHVRIALGCSDRLGDANSAGTEVLLELGVVRKERTLREDGEALLAGRHAGREDEHQRRATQSHIGPEVERDSAGDERAHEQGQSKRPFDAEVVRAESLDARPGRLGAIFLVREADRDDSRGRRADRHGLAAFEFVGGGHGAEVPLAHMANHGEVSRHLVVGDEDESTILVARRVSEDELAVFRLLEHATEGGDRPNREERVESAEEAEDQFHEERRRRRRIAALAVVHGVALPALIPGSNEERGGADDGTTDEDVVQHL